MPCWSDYLITCPSTPLGKVSGVFFSNPAQTEPRSPNTVANCWQDIGYYGGIAYCYWQRSCQVTNQPPSLCLSHLHKVTWILGVLLGPNMFDGPWWITLYMSTCLMLLLLLFNLGRGLWMLYSTKTERWSMRIQHMDNRSNAGPGSGRFHEALHRLAWALFGQYFLRKRFK